jgi:N-acetylneuraminic acid mutarotase
MLAYEAKSARWLAAGELPFSLVTTVAVPWHKEIVIPGGEIRPGIRSTTVWAGRSADFPKPIWTPVPPPKALAPGHVNPLP